MKRYLITVIFTSILCLKGVKIMSVGWLFLIFSTDNRDRNLNSSDRKLVTKSERTAGMVFHM